MRVLSAVVVQLGSVIIGGPVVGRRQGLMSLILWMVSLSICFRMAPRLVRWCRDAGSGAFWWPLMVSPDMAFPSLGALSWEPSGTLLSGLALVTLFAGVMWPSLPIVACQFVVVVCVLCTTD